ncbi:sulfurtransferase [Mesorhizobium sp. SB112]|uniref:sulfurtransferase n=1 Tax=Mesorhizobium sp. SB112 TaxID=3151853 RepID=UPI0032636AB7
MPNDNSSDRQKVLVTAEELAARIDGAEQQIILDIRFNLQTPDGRPHYREGHIPGAVYADLPTELAGVQKGFSGRRPLPEIADLQRDARRWGINEGDTVIVYDDNFGQQAARAWWVLRWAGITDVRLLDGGLAAWKALGRSLSTEVPLPDYGNVSLSAGNLPVLSADDAQDFARSRILLDARDAKSYAGAASSNGRLTEGHIPGAFSAPTSQNLDEAGRFKSADVLRERFEKLGIKGSEEVGVYCGGGVSATHEIISLASIGIPAALFPGSWSAWSSDPSRPVATGTERG